MKHRPIILLLALIAGFFLNPVAGAAQGLGLGAKSGKPIEVFADHGIEWQKEDRRYIARGNAKAIQGTTTVYGDTLIAYYEDKGNGGKSDTEIYRIDSIGNVKIVSPTETAWGDKGVYDIINGVLVMTGKKLRMETRSEIITARDALEYYEKTGTAIARGRAEMKARPRAGEKGARRVKGDVLTVRFDNDQKTKGGTKKSAATKKGQVRRMDAYGNVMVIRPGEFAVGDRGVYFPKTGVAHLWGKVKITRGDNQLNGERAVVNLKTGISHIVSDKKAGAAPPVRMLLTPKK